MEEKKVNNQNDDRRQDDSPENQGDHDPKNIPGDNGNAQGMTDNDPNDANSKESGKEEKPTTKAHQKTEDHTSYDFTKLRLSDFRNIAFLDHIPKKQPFLLYYKGEKLTYQAIGRAADFGEANKKCLNAFIIRLGSEYPSDFAKREVAYHLNQLNFKVNDYETGNIPITRALLQALFRELYESSINKVSVEHRNTAESRDPYGYYHWSGYNPAFNFSNDRGYYFDGRFYLYRDEKPFASRPPESPTDFPKSIRTELKKTSSSHDLPLEQRDRYSDGDTSSQVSSITDSNSVLNHEKKEHIPSEEDIIEKIGRASFYKSRMLKTIIDEHKIFGERRLMTSEDEASRRYHNNTKEKERITLFNNRLHNEIEHAATRLEVQNMLHEIVEHTVMKSEDEYSSSHRLHEKTISTIPSHDHDIKTDQQGPTNNDPEKKPKRNFRPILIKRKLTIGPSNKKTTNTKAQERQVRPPQTTDSSNSLSSHPPTNDVSREERSDPPETLKESRELNQESLETKRSEKNSLTEYYAGAQYYLKPVLEYPYLELGKEYIKVLMIIGSAPFDIHCYIRDRILETTHFGIQAVDKRVHERWDEIQRAKNDAAERKRADDIAYRVLAQKQAFKRNWENYCRREGIENPISWQEAWKQGKKFD